MPRSRRRRQPRPTQSLALRRRCVKLPGERREWTLSRPPLDLRPRRIGTGPPRRTDSPRAAALPPSPPRGRGTAGAMLWYRPCRTGTCPVRSGQSARVSDRRRVPPRASGASRRTGTVSRRLDEEAPPPRGPGRRRIRNRRVRARRRSTTADISRLLPPGEHRRPFERGDDLVRSRARRRARPSPSSSGGPAGPPPRPGDRPRRPHRAAGRRDPRPPRASSGHRIHQLERRSRSERRVREQESVCRGAGRSPPRPGPYGIARPARRPPAKSTWGRESPEYGERRNAKRSGRPPSEPGETEQRQRGTAEWSPREHSSGALDLVRNAECTRKQSRGACA